MKIIAPCHDISLVNADCLRYMASMPDSSIDLIVSDPPYFGVKTNDWDNQWPNVPLYLEWMERVMTQMVRILKPNGSIYLFSGHKYAADIEILMRKHFNVLNNITWAKPTGIFRRGRVEDLRTYAPSTERILFAEQYNAEKYAQGGLLSYTDKCNKLAHKIYAPLIEYFKKAREIAGVSAAQIHAATGSQMCSHWFSYSQWQLPTEQHYRKLQPLFNGALNREYSNLKDEYEARKKEYQGLKKEYQGLRRSFYVTKHDQYIDVWNFAPVPYYSGKHPCEKPAEMIDHILLASSREGDVVFDAFMGSGSTPLACQRLNRKFIGCEMDLGYFDEIVKKLRSEP
ncbi:DNA methyltransferase [Photobacterium damselae subsp. damselae]|uniref:DNA-methyltransferase n=1 Tax=Photobacterium damselae TaxID=38293 RepID=UPI00311ACBF7